MYGKKKKKTFYQRAKKYGQQGNYGKGRSLSKEEYNYYINMLEQLRHIDGTDKAILIRSILSTMVKEEKVKDLSTNQLVSRMLDDILPHASMKHVLPIMDVFADDLRVMCMDPFASHVLQTLLTLGLKYIQKDAKYINEDRDDDTPDEFIPVDDKSKNDFQSFIFKTSKFVYNNLEDFIHETYASHIVRTVMEVCSGVEVSSSVKCSSKSQTFHSIKDDPKQVLFVPDSLTKIWADILDRIRHLPHFSDVIASDCGSAVLQTALLTLSVKVDTDRISGLASHIIEHGFLKLSDPSAEIHPLFEYNSTCRLMEVVISNVSDKQQEVIYGAFFRENMSKLVKHELANFSVQRLFSSWKSKELLPTLHKAHSECLEEAFVCGNNGVLLSFVQACRKLNSCQARCLKSLMKVLECSEPKDSQIMFGTLLFYFLKLKDYEERKKNNNLPLVSLFGTLILQELLHFNKPIKIIRSILEMSTSELVKIMGDARGSHVIDTFTSSEFVGEANRGQLISKMEGNFVTLACSKHGSYSLENLWNVSSMKVKTKISQELFESTDQLQDNRFGQIIYSKFKLRFFNTHERKDWGEFQQKDHNKREFLKRMLQETTDEATLPSPKKKKKKKEKKNIL